jgi:hypothetical protein
MIAGSEKNTETMSRRPWIRRRRGFIHALGLVSLLCALSLGHEARAQSAPNAAIPDFSSNEMKWVLMNGTAYFKVPGDTGPGPIMQRGREYKHDDTPRVAETNNPILKPWAKKLMDDANDKVLAGGIPFYPTSRCMPGGVPGLLLYPGEPVVFVQTPKEVWILYQRDAQVRRVYLDVPHSKNPPYSWYGESVGHYENGDTLVVDTVGLDDKGPIDRFRTPHTRQLHVVERYRLNNDGKNIEIVFTVDDPGAFTMPWKAKVDFERLSGARAVPWLESICAENPVDYFADDKAGAVPIPHGDRPDF